MKDYLVSISPCNFSEGELLRLAATPADTAVFVAVLTALATS